MKRKKSRKKCKKGMQNQGKKCQNTQKKCVCFPLQSHPGGGGQLVQLGPTQENLPEKSPVSDPAPECARLLSTLTPTPGGKVFLGGGGTSHKKRPGRSRLSSRNVHSRPLRHAAATCSGEVHVALGGEEDAGVGKSVFTHYS